MKNLNDRKTLTFILDTLKFYYVLGTIGTDFSSMATLFPGRTRSCMKRKFKREEKIRGNFILKALSCQRTFDLSLLERKLSECSN